VDDAKGGSNLVPALLALNSLLLLGVLAAIFLRQPPAAKAPAAADPAGHGAGPGASIGPTQRLPDFVVHLRNAEADRYARISFEVEVPGEEEKNRIAAQLPRIRDTFIAYLSDRTLEELRGGEGLQRTKEALLQKLHDLAPSAHVRALYVTDLVVQ